MSTNEFTFGEKHGQKDWKSMALPMILMATGLILVAGDHFGFLSFYRIQNLWPMAVILVGLAELIPAQGER